MKPTELRSSFPPGFESSPWVKHTTETAQRSAELLGLVGKKWVPSILGQLQISPKGFEELRRVVYGVSPRQLSATLQDLTGAGLLTRTELPNGTGAGFGRTLYTLTPLGVVFVEALRTFQSTIVSMASGVIRERVQLPWSNPTVERV